ncbi:MAG: DUF748 domain-containing protein [Proteobacteria bacterium]|nr:DUF748 domain-containing protein [Pseudomonadota bacterium]MBU1737784.1 DUF748 domain-containing protein [Pseudomonadota bacterium]
MNDPESEEIVYSGPERRKAVRPSLPRGGSARRKVFTGRRLVELFLTWSLVLFTLYTLSGYFIIPSVINNLLPALLSGESLRVSLSSSSFNPFTFQLDIHDLTVTRIGRPTPTPLKPVLVIQGLHLNIESGSLFKRVLICRNVNFNGVSLEIERREDLSYNFSDLGLLPAMDKTGNNSAARAVFPPFVLQNISLVNGYIRFIDRPGGKEHLVEQILLNLPFLSNLETAAFFIPSPTREHPIQPRFSAVFNGSPVAMRGRSDSNLKSNDTRLDLKLHGLELATYLPYLPDFKQTDILSGQADLDLELIFAGSPGSGPALQLQGVVNLSDLKMIKSGGITLSLPETFVRGRFSPLTNQLALQEIIVTQPVLTLPPDTPESPESKKTSLMSLLNDLPPGAFRHELNRLQLIDGLINQKMASGDKPAPLWTGIEIEVLPSTAGADASSSFTGKGETPGGALFSGRGTISSSPLEIVGTITTADLQFGKLKTFLPEPLGTALADGTLKMGSVNFRLSYLDDLPQPTLNLTDLALELHDLSFTLNGYRATLPTIKSVNGNIDLTRKIFSFGIITGDHPSFDFTPEIFLAAPPEGASEKASWLITSRVLDLTDAKITVGDLLLTRAEFHGESLGTEEGVPGKIHLRGTLADRGEIDFSGELGLAPLTASLSGRIANLPLTELQMSLHPFLIPNITAGEISGEGTLAFPSLKVAADLSIKELATEISAGKRSLTCPVVSMKGVELQASPLSLIIKTLGFERPEFQATMTDRKSPALSGYIFPESETTAISSDTVTIENGTFRLIDHSTMPSSEVILASITAKMTGMRNRPAAIAPFELTGTWQLVNSQGDGAADQQSPSAPFQATGTAALFGGNPLFDVNLQSSGIDINAFAPFLGPLLGYQPDKGTLSISTTFHLADHRIKAGNTIRIEKFSLGQGLSGRYNTPLAAALLTDRQGLITIDAPVSGKTGAPTFSYAGAIGEQIREILSKTTLAPFSLLGITEKAGRASLEYLSFSPGIAELNSAQIEQLQELALAINSRPLLKIAISGHVDPELDLLALQTSQGSRGRTLTGKDRDQDSIPGYSPQGIMTTPTPESNSSGRVSPSDDDLIQLARQRGRNVRDQLLNSGLAAARIAIDEDNSLEDELLNRPAGRVDLDLHGIKKF